MLVNDDAVFSEMQSGLCNAYWFGGQCASIVIWVVCSMEKYF